MEWRARPMGSIWVSEGVQSTAAAVGGSEIAGGGGGAARLAVTCGKDGGRVRKKKLAR
jgi:hypothetical protein